MNKHGLKRDIPAAVKREVRQNCGFGCVVCGLSIYEYEHIDPSYSEAKEHDPKRIALLCPQCHAKVTRGFMSKESVKDALNKPYCKSTGFSNEFFDFGTAHPQIVFGGVTLKNCNIPIQVKDVPLFEIKAPEENGGPFLLSAHFYNSRGEEHLVIEDNEWKVANWNWDVETVGGAITIKDRPRHIALKLRADPPRGIVVEKVDMYVKGYYFSGNESEIYLTAPGQGQLKLKDCIFDGCHIGMSIG